MALGIAALISGCATGAPDTMLLQQGTTNKLGLSSTDEVTISNIQKALQMSLAVVLSHGMLLQRKEENLPVKP